MEMTIKDPLWPTKVALIELHRECSRGGVFVRWFHRKILLKIQAIIDALPDLTTRAKVVADDRVPHGEMWLFNADSVEVAP